MTSIDPQFAPFETAWETFYKNQETSGCVEKSSLQLGNQSRICGEEVGLDLYPSDSLHFQSYEFIEILQIGPYYGVEKDCRNFVQIVLTVFEKIEKKIEKSLFLTSFGLILATFLASQHTILYHCTYGTLVRCRMTVETFV